MKSRAPSWSAWVASSSSSVAVTTTTGTSGAAPTSRRKPSSPAESGRPRSRNTQVTCWSRMTSSAREMLSAPSTSMTPSKLDSSIVLIAWAATGSSSTTSTASSRISVIHFITHLAQRAIDASLDRCQLFFRQSGDLRNGEIGAESQSNRLAFLLAERLERAPNRVAGLHHLLARIGSHLSFQPVSLQGTALHISAARVIPKAIQGDRIEPVLLAAATALEAAPRSECSLERLGNQVLRQGPIAGSIRQKTKEVLGVELVELLEIFHAHRRMIPPRQAVRAGSPVRN